MRPILITLTLLFIAGCVEPKPRDDGGSFALDLIEKSCLVNSADAILYGEYRVELHQRDLVHPKWRVVKGGETILVGDMITCLQRAIELREAGK